MRWYGLGFVTDIYPLECFGFNLVGKNFDTEYDFGRCSAAETDTKTEVFVPLFFLLVATH